MDEKGRVASELCLSITPRNLFLCSLVNRESEGCAKCVSTPQSLISGARLIALIKDSAFSHQTPSLPIPVSILR